MLLPIRINFLGKDWNIVLKFVSLHALFMGIIVFDAYFLLLSVNCNNSIFY